MKTIIVPIDFSPTSYNACMYAAKMAQDIKAELVLLHVMELPIAVAEFPVTENVFDSIGIEKKLEEIKTKLIEETSDTLKIETKNIFGSAEHEIKEICKIRNPFAVIMGTHSYSAIDRFFTGSTTVFSAKHLHNPVLIIPADVKYKPIKKIALASDLKDVYEMPVQKIEMIVKQFNAELEILYVGKNQEDINKHTVESLLLDHRLLNLNPHFYFVEDEDIMLGIISLAKKQAIDLLIIIPKKHGPFHKSQAKDFIFYADVPVMAIHKDDIAENV
jgi:nucleotide-binding universal stress UspA family protein